MDINFCRPKSKILQKYIDGYYFLNNKITDPVVEYYAFPNNFSLLSVIKDVEIIFEENKGIIKEKLGNSIVSELICHYKVPLKFTYEGNISEITFCFKPLGLNAFVGQSLCTYTNSFFSSFMPFEDYQSFFNDIFNETNFDKKCDMIENYWLSKLIGFNHAFLHHVVDDLTNSRKDYNIIELAKKYHTSRQHLTKQFEIHLCKSPSEFKKILRFRQALKTHMLKNTKENLTTLSYEMLFYDQSHLIKDFKSLTRLTPKKFFDTISYQEVGDVCWLFE